MLHDYSNENVGEANSEKNEEENCEFLNQESLPYKMYTVGILTT